VCVGNLSSSVATSAVESGLVEGFLGSATVTGIACSLTVGGLGGLGNVRGGVVSSDGGGVGRGVGALGRGSGGGGGLAFGSDLFVKGVETLGLGAVKVEPPVADEVVLVEDGAVGTQEAVLG